MSSTPVAAFDRRDRTTRHSLSFLITTLLTSAKQVGLLPLSAQSTGPVSLHLMVAVSNGTGLPTITVNPRLRTRFLSPHRTGPPGSPLVFAHNLVNGAYPYTGDGSSFTGGAFDNGDLGGSYITCQYSTAVRYTNNGFMIPAGTNIIVDSCTAVTTGYADNGTLCSSPFGNRFTSYYEGTYPDVNPTMTNNFCGHLRWTGTGFERADYYLPETGTYSGNTSLGSNPTETDVTNPMRRTRRPLLPQALPSGRSREVVVFPPTPARP